uniref:transposase n=1 Tax=Paenibacillus senegalensis TaxID=1465766 RepID=UPI003709A77C
MVPNVLLVSSGFLLQIVAVEDEKIKSRLFFFAHRILVVFLSPAIYARRKVEVENVFGHLKGNRSFRRFSLRGLNKVHVEFGIMALAHNLLKVEVSA